eukprot:UN00700
MKFEDFQEKLRNAQGSQQRRNRTKPPVPNSKNINRANLANTTPLRKKDPVNHKQRRKIRKQRARYCSIIKPKKYSQSKLNLNLIKQSLLRWRIDGEYDIGEIPSRTVKLLCETAEDILLKEPTVLKVKEPVYIIGDIRGDFFHLLRIFEQCGYPAESKFIFCGNYVGGLRSLVNPIIVIDL